MLSSGFDRADQFFVDTVVVDDDDDDDGEFLSEFVATSTMASRSAMQISFL